jgi:hypothetical protein
MKIKYVSGIKIRNTIDADFGVIGSNKIYSYIPKGEIWFDGLYKEEKEHFLKIHLYELGLMKRMSYEKARKIIEKKFNYVPWEEFVKKTKKKIPDLVVRIRKYKGYIVKYVDGRTVRKYINPKFILGIHLMLNKKARKKEIWVDIRQDKREYKYTLIHEYEEARLMRKGMSYNDAHGLALAYEKAARRKDGARYLKD